MAGRKAFLELQVGLRGVFPEPLVFPERRESGGSPSLDRRATRDQRGREESQGLLDSRGSRVGPDLLVNYRDQTLQDQWESPVCLGWTANTVSRVLQVLPGPLVQAHPKETGGTLGFQVSQAPLAGKETLDSLEAPDFLGILGSKDCEETPASAAVLD